MAAEVKQKVRDLTPVQHRDAYQSWLAREIGCSSAAVCRVLSGSLTSPYIQTAIAKVLGADPETLWGDLWWFPRYCRTKYGKRAS
jgi:lambda repressor-like predicted transcriptional regulator